MDRISDRALDRYPSNRTRYGRRRLDDGGARLAGDGGVRRPPIRWPPRPAASVVHIDLVEIGHFTLARRLLDHSGDVRVGDHGRVRAALTRWSSRPWRARPGSEKTRRDDQVVRAPDREGRDGLPRRGSRRSRPRPGSQRPLRCGHQLATSSGTSAANCGGVLVGLDIGILACRQAGRSAAEVGPACSRKLQAQIKPLSPGSGAKPST